MVFLKMDIKNAQQAVDQWIQKHGVRYFNELTNLAQLTEEVGEVANQTGIDLQEVFDKKLILKTDRDHLRHQNNPKLKR